MKYRELGKMLPATGDVKRVPSPKMLRESCQKVVLENVSGDGDMLMVYESGYCSYASGGHATVFAWDKCVGCTVDNEGYDMAADEFADYDWFILLTCEGMRRLEHSRDVRTTNTYSYDNLDCESSDLADPVDFTKGITDRDEVEHLLDKLTEKQRQVVEMYYVDGLTQQQIADRLGISQQMVTKHINAAMKFLKNYFSYRL